MNGALAAQMNASDINDKTNATEMWFGRNQWSESFQGRLDEIRLAPVVRSADWIAAEFAQAGDGFVEFGASGPASTVFFF